MVVIGTRGSKLALVQAHWVSGELTKHGHENRIEIIKTKGDVVQDRFDKIEGKGFFTREIEDALSNGDIDLAVHCLKDLPTASPEGLVNKAITEREDPYDILVSTKPFKFLDNGFPDLNGQTVGTSSNRRVAGLQHHYENASFAPLRGNVPTRLEKLKRGDADTIVLACAGINRLSMPMDEYYTFRAAPPLLVPAPAQGALALQVREGYELDLSFLHHDMTKRCTDGERHILSALEGGCQLPLGVLIRERGPGVFHLELFLGKSDRYAENVHLSMNGDTPEAVTEEAMTKLRELGCLPS